MRVIAGVAKGRRLTEFKGRDVRPTPDRVREALFSILQSKLGDFNDLRVLDLFAGSGALSIEALSRGAATACLVDKATSSIRIAVENLERCQLKDRATVITAAAITTLPTFGAKAFDLIFIDPPYDQGLAEEALVEIDRLELLSDSGIICVETGSNESITQQTATLQPIDQRRYGTIMLHFYANGSEDQ